MAKQRVKLEPGAIDHAWPARAARYAISSIDNHTADSEADDLVEAVDRVWKKWRRTISKLDALGVYSGQPARAGMSKRCYPLGFRRPDFATFFCNSTYICPFCWGRRYAVEAYQRFGQLLGIGDGFREFTAGFRNYELTEALTEERVVRQDDADHVAELWSRLKTLRGEYRVAFKEATAAFSFMTLEPAGPAGVEGQWKWILRSRAILLTPPEIVPPIAEVDAPWKTRVKMESLGDGAECRVQLAAAIGRVASYPAGLLTANFLQQTKLYMEARQHGERGKKGKWRAAEYYGRLRGLSRS